MLQYFVFSMLQYLFFRCCTTYFLLLQYIFFDVAVHVFQCFNTFFLRYCNNYNPMLHHIVFSYIFTILQLKCFMYFFGQERGGGTSCVRDLGIGVRWGTSYVRELRTRVQWGAEDTGSVLFLTM